MQTCLILLVALALGLASATFGCDANGTDPAESPQGDGNRGTSAGRPGAGQ